MDALKEVLSFLGAVIGLISALIPLLGYLADKRRRDTRRRWKHVKTYHARSPRTRRGL